jgi:protein-S-isoprenylcysteine O-methyltransferase Ste14
MTTSETMTADPVAEVVFYAVIACWIGFAAVFALRKRPEKKAETTRNRVAGAGIFLQGLGYFAVWFWSRLRSGFCPLVPMPPAVEIALAVFTMAVAAGSIWLVMSAVRTLGKQWAIAARLVEGHKLITEGPYGWVRNPIYTGMFGMLLATGLAVSRWIALPAAIALFGMGTVIRVRSEEKLLREAFGEEFEQYTRRVPAVLPGVY